MAKIWNIPFANAGDKQTIPVPPEVDGSISVTQGWPSDYELPNTDPNYKPVGREEMNGALFEITESIQQLQQQGAAEWSVLLAPYANGSEVIHSGQRWRSPVSGNSTEPGAVGATWVQVSTVPAASETVSGIAEIATQAETDARTDDLRIVTPKKLGNGFAFSWGANGYFKLPTVFGGFMVQWGQPTAVSSVGNVTLPTPFPNSHFMTIANDFEPGAIPCTIGTNGFTLTQFSFSSAIGNVATNPGLFNFISFGR